MRRASLVGALLATVASGCQSSSIDGSTTGNRGPAECPASSVRQPDGTCLCYPNYEGCLDDAGGAICTNPQLDNDNCGTCGTVCAPGESCLGGNCQCHLTTCPTEDGGTICTDPELDPKSCGGCGSECPSGFGCVLGSCTGCEEQGDFCLTDAGAYCVDFLSDPGNCGGCGIQCSADQYCAAPAGAGGECVCPNDAGPGVVTDMQSCDGSCVDLDRDAYNCGACHHICLYGPCAMSDAGTGVCGCDPPFELCGPTCIDPRSDFEHCGGCSACSPPATQCVVGNCQ